MISKLLSFGAFQGVSKACQQHLLVLPVVQVRFLFLKNPCVSRCVAWQRYHDCTLLQRASAFIACSDLREEDVLFFLGSNIFNFFDSNGWSPRIKVLRTAEAGNSTAVCNSIEIFGSGVSEPECLEISMKHLKFPSKNYKKRSVFVALHSFLICPRQS